MSFAALAWAAQQRPGNLAAKMVLLGLANYANEDGCAYPSTAALAEFGDMDHKTATTALDRLVSLGLIIDSGERAGRTRQIKVYRLALESLPKTEAYQKRKPPVSSVKAPQKRGTDTVKEPITSEAKASSVERAPDFEKFIGDWNALAARYGLPPVRVLDAKRKAAIRARIAEHGLASMGEAMAAIGRSPFCRGETKDWRANVDFLLRPGNYLKLLEGGYDPPGTPKATPAEPKSPAETVSHWEKMATMAEKMNRDGDARDFRENAERARRAQSLGSIVASLAQPPPSHDERRVQ